MEEERSLGHRAPVLWLLLPLLAGFAAARALPAHAGGGAWLPAALAALGVAVWGRARADPRGPWLWRLGLATAVFFAGVAYLQWRENRLPVWDRLPPREAAVELTIERVFPAAPGRRTTSGLARIEAAPAVIAETVGQRIFFSLRVGDGAPPLLRSARVRAVGVLEALPRRPAGGFAAYLARTGATFRLTRGRVLTEVRQANAFFSLCGRAAGRFERILGTGLDDRPALRSIHVAMMLGSKAEMSDEQQALFLNSGTMHLFAISGLHIAVIWAALSALLALLRTPRPAAIAAGLSALFLYVEITGGAPSARRAWLMIAFVLAAELLRWPRNPLAGIAASALVVVLLDPFQFLGAGFQMSYSVVAALLLHGLTLEERLQRHWHPWASLPEPAWRWWRKAVRWTGRKTVSAFALCAAATLVSIPTSIDLFGVFTPGALLTNLVLIPASSLSIVAGFGSLLAGLAGLEAVSSFFNHASILVIWLMERGLEAALRLPGMYWAAAFRAGWLGPAALVAMLAAMTAGYAAGWRRSVGGLWLPVVLLVAVLGAGVRHGAAEGVRARDLPAGRPTASPARP